MAQNLVAARAFKYRGRALKAGDEFEPASEKDARTLIAFGRASVQGAAAEPAKKGRYRRRDLRAEDGG